MVEIFYRIDAQTLLSWSFEFTAYYVSSSKKNKKSSLTFVVDQETNTIMPPSQSVQVFGK